MVSLAKDYGIGEPQVICSCGKVVYEIDVINCSACGDISCESCYSDCFGCGKMFCIHCSDSSTQCLRCALSKQEEDEKAFLMIGGISTPIKNSAFMINKTSLPNARDIKLTINDIEYRYLYRSLQQKEEDRMKCDYFLYFEEVPKKTKNSEDYINDKIRDALKNWNEAHGMYGDEYDDYSTDWMWQYG